MASRKDIISVLKQALRARGLTYAQLARQLNLSEISIKRGFAQGNFKLDRLEKICRVIDLEIGDLTRLADEQEAKISQLSIEQEQELVADKKFLLVAICVQNAWQLDEITDVYAISETECIRYLIRLEKQGLIRLLPGNRVRRLLSQDFQWCKGGPIESFFQQEVQREYFSADFSASGELRQYLIGMLSAQSIQTLEKSLVNLQKTFSELQEADAALPISRRKNIGLFLAFRPWELSIFSSMKH